VPKFDIDLAKLKKAIADNPNIGARTLAKVLGVTRYRAGQILKDLDLYLSEQDNEFLKAAAKLQKEKQKLLDLNRIERKIRSEIRVENALEEVTKELIRVFENREPYEIKPRKIFTDSKVGILHLSDLHFNELVELEHNTYDFKVASKRLKKFVSKAIPLFTLNSVDTVLIAFTGDLINSDRRLDEKLSCATNRARATALAAILLEQLILEVSEQFNVSVAVVSGNESRINAEWGASEIVISDNYDIMVVELLKLMFRNTPVQFIDGPLAEKVVNLKGHNILMLHGTNLAKDICKKIQQIKGKYNDRGVTIDFVIFGHIHEAQIADLYARSSSLVGANAYSDTDLQLSSRASQNIHIISDTGIDSMKIDLQDVEGIEGYTIDESLEEYNAKSVSKCRAKHSKYYVVAEIS